MKAVVVGAGVIGLTTGVVLAESGIHTRIVTKDLPHDTTSSVAAALWYPYRVNPRDRALAWGADGLSTLTRLARTEPESGVYHRDAVELFRDDDPAEPWWADIVGDLRWLDAEDLPAGCSAAATFRVPVVEMPIYLTYLAGRFAAAGGIVEEAVVDSLDDVAADGVLVVNCTGVYAGSLAADHSVMPIRGQVVQVTNPGLDRVLIDEENPGGVTYIVPRSTDCILGGTAQDGDWSLRPDRATAESILARCAVLEPRLSGAAVLGDRVGLRPGRPAVRLERTRLSNGSPCLHNYGHGGAGVTLSWGCAYAALDLAHTD